MEQHRHAVLTLWGVRPSRVPAAAARMALDRRHLHRVPGLVFAKLLGTGDGRTFTVRDADPLHWGLLSVWDAAPDDDDDDIASRLGTTYRAWHRIADERLDVGLLPIASRGRWAGQEPFGRPTPTRPPVSPTASRAAGPTAGLAAATATPVAALTRARLRPSRARSFWKAVPPVSADLRTVAGLRLAVGVGEAPIGLQGTFSLWEDAAALTDFAHRRSPHAQVAARTPGEGWYAEELFARFAVTRISGTFRGVEPLNDRPVGDRADGERLGTTAPTRNEGA